MVRHREGARQLVVEGQIGLVVPVHRAGAVVERLARSARVGRLPEPWLTVTKPSIAPLSTSWCVPGHSWSVSAVHGCARVLPGHDAAVDARVARIGGRALDVRPAGVLVQVAEVAVERVVFHHHDDDVVDRDVAIDREARAERGGRHVAALVGARRPVAVGRVFVGPRHGRRSRRRAWDGPVVAAVVARVGVRCVVVLRAGASGEGRERACGQESGEGERTTHRRGLLRRPHPYQTRAGRLYRRA